MGGADRGENGKAEGRAPLVSVVMANWQGESHLGAAVGSVLAQSMDRLELLVADDSSTDGSLAIALAAAERDARVRVLPGSRNAGPSEARNRALDAARGEWVAIVDNDDLLHPRRLELMLGAAERSGADLVGDDLAHFGAGADDAARTLLAPLGLRDLTSVDTATFVKSNRPGSRLPSLGYIKPLIRRGALGTLRYDERLRLGEDYDFYLRLLLAGKRLVLLPLPLYLYRRHAASLSHRLSVALLEPLTAANEELRASLGATDREVEAALEARSRSLQEALRYERLVEAMKSGERGRAAALLARRPSLLRPLSRSLRERVARRGHRAEAPDPEGRPAQVALVAPGGAVPEDALGGAAPERIEAPPLGLDHLGLAPQLGALAARLTGLAARGPVDVAAIGFEGLDALGLMPEWRTAEVWLPEGAPAPPLPAGARLRRLGAEDEPQGRFGSAPHQGVRSK